MNLSRLKVRLRIPAAFQGEEANIEGLRLLSTSPATVLGLRRLQLLLELVYLHIHLSTIPPSFVGLNCCLVTQHITHKRAKLKGQGE